MSKNLNVVKSIGAALRKTETAVPAIVATLPDGFDPAVRGAVAEAVQAWACGDAERPAQKIGPKGAQRATDYGRGVDALVKAVKAALNDSEPAAPDYLALAVAAAKTAHDKGNVATDALMAAIVAALVIDTAPCICDDDHASAECLEHPTCQGQHAA